MQKRRIGRGGQGWIVRLGMVWFVGLVGLAQQADGAPSPCPHGMSEIPAGDYLRGSRKGRLDEQPVRKIRIRRFCLDRTEVSMAAYRKCVQSGRCSPTGKPLNDYAGQRPAVYVDWHQARAYCKAVGKRLPTEAQWERAARADRPDALYPLQGSITCQRANYGALPTYPCQRGHSKVPEPVSRYEAGPFGLHNMAGNVSEWVADCYVPDYYRESPTQDPVARPCSKDAARVIRGGSFSSPLQDLRITARKAAWAHGVFFDVGFRCAKDLP